MLYVSMPFATFGLIIAGGVVVDAPPIARYTLGWTAQRAVSYFRGRGALVEPA